MENFTPCFSESTCVLPNSVSVPLLMPIVTLMERQAVTFEGTDMWEKNDESCEMLMNHLAAARVMAEGANSYRTNAQKVLEGKRCLCKLLHTLHSNWTEGLNAHGCSQLEKDQVRKIGAWKLFPI